MVTVTRSRCDIQCMIIITLSIIPYHICRAEGVCQLLVTVLAGRQTVSYDGILKARYD